MRTFTEKHLSDLESVISGVQQLKLDLLDSIDMIKEIEDPHEETLERLGWLEQAFDRTESALDELEEAYEKLEMII